MQPFLSASRLPAASSRRLTRLPFFLLVLLAAVVVYLPALRAEFLILDDSSYVTGHPYILYPSWRNLAAFFTEVLKPSVVAGYYQPLTMASLMLDRVIEARLAGALASRIDPSVFHLTNVLLHSLCAGLVFVLVLEVTTHRWAAFLCGLVFAVHPLNVEVVAWISQRKALLSTLFALCMLLAYLRYAATHRSVWYVLTILSFIFGLLSKPTGLLLPLVLLLLDVWPLRRWSRRAVLEKLPLLGLAMVGGWIAYESQTSTVDLTDAGHHRGLLLTALIAGHNLVFYLAKIVLPIRLCPQYILPPEYEITALNWPFAAGLVFTTALALIGYFAYRRRHDAVWTMLVAFVLLLGPTLGPVRFTGTIAADRFVYLPMIAVLILAGHLAARCAREVQRFIFACAIVVLVVFAAATWRQQAVWQNSASFYQAVIARFPDSPGGYYGLGNAYLDKYDESLSPRAGTEGADGRDWIDQALQAHRKAVAIDPLYARSYYRVGHILIVQGHTAEGIDVIKKGLSLPRADPEGHFFLALAYTHVGAYAESIPHYQACLAQRASWIEVHRNLANALLRTGRAAEALPHYQRLYELNPADLDGRQNWAVARIAVGDAQGAIKILQDVIAVRASLVIHLSDDRQAAQASNLADARYTLAGALAIVGDLPAAMENLRLALQEKPELLEQAEKNRAFDSLKDTDDWRNLRAPAPPK
ncbi:MAG TPA: tetratricopeptide repeat protein [Phycisphaerae bacterium]|nr:tetratricopeptide repeat protein [Phycisphaerae bacterium]